MVEATIFIPLIILAITQFIKDNVSAVKGNWTVLVAFGVGVLVALFDGFLGVTDISIAQGLMFAIGAIGIAAGAKKASGK